MNALNDRQHTLRLLACLCLLAATTGCKKEWLNVKPTKNQAIPSKLSDYRAMLNHAAILNGNCMAIGEVASDGHYVTEAVWTATKDVPAINAYTWSQGTPYPASEPYTSSYSRVYQANLIMEGLAILTVSTEAERKERDELRGRALFIKAITYYWLSQLYAQPYRAATAATDQGILTQANSSFLDNVKRVTVAETYSLIIGYLEEAMPLLPVKADHVTHASQSAVNALLTRVYLCMQQYDKALQYAKASLDAQSTLLDYSKLPTNGFFVGNFNAEVLYHDEMSNGEVANFSTYSALIDPSLYNSYDANDLRKAIFFTVSGANITFKGNYNNNGYLLFCGLATDETYLVRAECLARQGDVSGAMKDLNELLRNRWKKNPDGTTTYVDQTAADANAALQLILTERKKELILRGSRWADLRRLNATPATAVTLTRSIGGKTYTLEPNSYRYTFPLPVNVLTLSGQPQTTGWE
jgi:tetratricopeptide (TPR) repeat protein